MKSLFKIAQSIGGHNTKTKPEEVTYKIFGKNSKDKSAVFTVGSKIRNQMRWISGDRIDILYDSDLAEGQLVRCREGGWQLCDLKKDSSPARIRVSLRPEFGLPMVEEKIELAVALTDNTIAFAFPTKYRKQMPVAPKGVAK